MSPRWASATYENLRMEVLRLGQRFVRSQRTAIREFVSLFSSSMESHNKSLNLQLQLFCQLICEQQWV